MTRKTFGYSGGCFCSSYLRKMDNCVVVNPEAGKTTKRGQGRVQFG